MIIAPHMWGFFYYVGWVMMRIYIIIIGGLMVIGAYWAGNRVGRFSVVAQCNADAVARHIQTIKQMDKINAETNHTAVRDIRRILREKYTISQ